MASTVWEFSDTIFALNCNTPRRADNHELLSAQDTLYIKMSYYTGTRFLNVLHPNIKNGNQETFNKRLANMLVEKSSYTGTRFLNLLHPNIKNGNQETFNKRLANMLVEKSSYTGTRFLNLLHPNIKNGNQETFNKRLANMLVEKVHLHWYKISQPTSS
ncbi:hypothetical protein J6590_081337 [Homalodisca vitripennis]|nr:hypothetical protein J6590_081337 [Homalodisca vitripennis]